MTSTITWIIGAAIIGIAAAFVIRAKQRSGGNTSIRHKVIALSVGAGVVAVTIVAFLSLSASNDALLSQQQQALQAIRAGRQAQIKRYFNIPFGCVFG